MYCVDTLLSYVDVGVNVMLVGEVLVGLFYMCVELNYSIDYGLERST